MFPLSMFNYYMLIFFLNRRSDNTPGRADKCNTSLLYLCVKGLTEISIQCLYLHLF